MTRDERDIESENEFTTVDPRRLMEPYKALEHEWAEWNCLDPQGMVVCSSGTAALHLALEAMRLPQGSEVIVPDFTMVAVPRAVVLAGLKPVFVDCRDDLNIDVTLLERLGSTTAERALVAVHTYGRQCNMECIGHWCKVTCGGYITSDVMLIEDMAEAHGVQPNRYTDAACWSFYRNKIVHGEEGGAVWFRDATHATLARQLRSLGFTEKHDFTHVPRGHNYRMSNAHARLVLKSLRDYDKNVERRLAFEAAYDEQCPQEWRMPKRDAPWVYDLRIPGMTEREQDAVVAVLNEAGITARHAFKPMHRQEEFHHCKLVSNPVDRGDGTMSLLASREVLYLQLDTGKSGGRLDISRRARRCARQAFRVIREALARRTPSP